MPGHLPLSLTEIMQAGISLKGTCFPLPDSRLSPRRAGLPALTVCVSAAGSHTLFELSLTGIYTSPKVEARPAFAPFNLWAAPALALWAQVAWARLPLSPLSLRV